MMPCCGTECLESSFDGQPAFDTLLAEFSAYMKSHVRNVLVMSLTVFLIACAQPIAMNDDQVICDIVMRSKAFQRAQRDVSHAALMIERGHDPFVEVVIGENTPEIFHRMGTLRIDASGSVFSLETDDSGDEHWIRE